MGDTIPTDETRVKRGEVTNIGLERLERVVHELRCVGWRTVTEDAEQALTQFRGVLARLLAAMIDADDSAALITRQAQEIDDLRATADRLKDELDDALAQIRPLEQQVADLTTCLAECERNRTNCAYAASDLTLQLEQRTAERDAAAANARNERAYADRIRKRYHENRPRCGVVTSPRFYSDGQRYAALRRMIDFWPGIDSYEPIDAVAAALGMRRAAK